MFEQPVSTTFAPVTTTTTTDTAPTTSSVITPENAAPPVNTLEVTIAPTVTTSTKILPAVATTSYTVESTIVPVAMDASLVNSNENAITDTSPKSTTTTAPPVTTAAPTTANPTTISGSKTPAPSVFDKDTNKVNFKSATTKTPTQKTTKSREFTSTSEPDYGELGPKYNKSKENQNNIGHSAYSNGGNGKAITSTVPPVTSSTLPNPYYEATSEGYGVTTAPPPETTTPLKSDKEVNETALKVILGPQIGSKQYQGENDEVEGSGRTEVLDMDQYENKPQPGQVAPPPTTTPPPPTPSVMVAAPHPDEEIEEILEDQERNKAANKTYWPYNLNPIALPPAYSRVIAHDKSSKEDIGASGEEGKEENKPIKDLKEDKNGPTNMPSTTGTRPSTKPPFTTKSSDINSKNPNKEVTSTPSSTTASNIKHEYDTITDDIVQQQSNIDVPTTVTSTSVTPTISTKIDSSGNIMGFPTYEEYLQDYISKINKAVNVDLKLATPSPQQFEADQSDNQQSNNDLTATTSVPSKTEYESTASPPDRPNQNSVLQFPSYEAYLHDFYRKLMPAQTDNTQQNTEVMPNVTQSTISLTVSTPSSLVKVTTKEPTKQMAQSTISSPTSTNLPPKPTKAHTEAAQFEAQTTSPTQNLFNLTPKTTVKTLVIPQMADNGAEVEQNGPKQSEDGIFADDHENTFLEATLKPTNSSTDNSQSENVLAYEERTTKSPPNAATKRPTAPFASSQNNEANAPGVPNGGYRPEAMPTNRVTGAPLPSSTPGTPSLSSYNQGEPQQSPGSWYNSYLENYYQSINEYYKNASQTQYQQNNQTSQEAFVQSSQTNGAQPANSINEDTSEGTTNRDNTNTKVEVTTTERPFTRVDVSRSKDATEITTTPQTSKSTATTTTPGLETEIATTENERTPSRPMEKPTTQPTTKVSSTEQTTTTRKVESTPESDIRPSPIPIVTMEINIIPRTEENELATTAPASVTTTIPTTTSTTTASSSAERFDNGGTGTEENSLGSSPVENVPENENIQANNKDDPTSTKSPDKTLIENGRYESPSEDQSLNQQENISEVKMYLTTPKPSVPSGTEKVPVTTTLPPEAFIVSTTLETTPVSAGQTKQPTTATPSRGSQTETSSNQSLIKSKPYVINNNAASDDVPPSSSPATTSSPHNQPTTNNDDKVISEVSSFVDKLAKSGVTFPRTEINPITLPNKPQSTKYPYNDLHFDYILNWKRYLAEIQAWVDRYMVPVEHHNISVHPDKHPTVNPSGSRYQNEYETYLANIELWESKNRVNQLMGIATTVRAPPENTVTATRPMQPVAETTTPSPALAEIKTVPQSQVDADTTPLLQATITTQKPQTVPETTQQSVVTPPVTNDAETESYGDKINQGTYSSDIKTPSAVHVYDGKTQPASNGQANEYKFSTGDGSIMQTTQDQTTTKEHTTPVTTTASTTLATTMSTVKGISIQIKFCPRVVMHIQLDFFNFFYLCA